MRYIVDSEQMRRADNNTSVYFGIPSMVLMERASLAIVEKIEKRFPIGTKIHVFAGNGGNGGDGICVGRILHLRGYQVMITLVKHKEGCNEICQKQIEIAEKYGVKFVEFDELTFDDTFEVIVDGLLGNGVNREIQGKIREMINFINQKSSYVYAIDLPSGIDANNGQVLGVAVRADETITFGFEKMGSAMYPGRGYCGLVEIAEIGITKESFLEQKPDRFAIEIKDLKEVLNRPSDGNKGTFGKVLVIAGSEGMAGACMFSAKSALRMGAGMVRIMTHVSNREIMQTQFPEAMLSLYSKEDTDFQKELEMLFDWADVAVVGPGISTSGVAKNLVDHVIMTLRKMENREKDYRCHTYLFDADAINLISQNEEHKEFLFHATSFQTVFTPHLMELSRLTIIPLERLKVDLEHEMGTFSKGKTAIFVCKDATTLILKDGVVIVNEIGTNALATAGSGDCLTGIVAALFAQEKLVSKKELSAHLLTAMGVCFHGSLGLFSEEKMNSASILTSDLIDLIPLTVEKTGIIETFRKE